MKLVCWNVNGIRAIGKKGFREWFLKTKADVVSLQEVKAFEEQVDSSVIDFPGYERFWHAAKKPGYSGTAIFTRVKPKVVRHGLEIEHFDSEGRALIAEYDDFTLVNCYFPNSQEEGRRLKYKIEFCDAILDFCKKNQKKKREVIVCGDFNVAHEEIDLARPKDNHESPGFLPDERAWMTKFLKSGMHDVFRERHPQEKDHYTWWSYRSNAREKNVGWRIDYHIVTPGLVDRVKDIGHMPEVTGSDHCPVYLVLKD